MRRLYRRQKKPIMLKKSSLFVLKVRSERGGRKSIENGLILTGSDAELLSRALAEVKTKVYEESETSLDDTQALDALLSSFRTAETEEREKEGRHTYLSPLRKRLMLGTIIDRQGERGQSQGLIAAGPKPFRLSRGRSAER